MTMAGGYAPITGSYQQISPLTAATALTVPKGTAPGEAGTQTYSGKAGPRMCIIVAEVADVRWRDDGTNPANGTGMLLTKGTILVYTGKPQKLAFIEDTNGNGAKLNVTYYA